MNAASRQFPSNPSHRVAPARKLALLDPRVRHSLHQLALDFSKLGVRVFLFGSVARTWPLAPSDADFDLGFEFDPSTPNATDLLRRLQDRVDSLPSIRSVDLVDFSRASPGFREEAGRCIVELTDDATATTTI